MKKYSKLVVLVGIVVIMFSYYYVQAGTLSETFGKIKIKTVEGDESFVDDVVIKGDYYGNYYNSESFEIRKDGTDFLRDKSYIERLDDYYLTDKVKQLRKENRQFMRMKDSNAESYIEYDDMIIYVSVPYTRWGIFKGYLQVETYNRTTKEKTITTIDTPDLLDYSTIEKMYLLDDQLYILVLNMEYDSAADTEKTILNIYEYNVTDDTLTNSIEVAFGDTDYYSDFTNIFVDNEESPTQLIVTGAAIDYEEIETEDAAVVGMFAEEDEDYREIVELTNVKKIDLQTGEVNDIKVKNMVENGVPVAFNGAEIIIVAPKENQLTYYAYDITRETMVEKQTIDTEANFISMWDFEMNVVTDNKVYTLINQNETSIATLLIIDTLTGELLYKGLVEGDLEDTKMQDPTEIYFHTLELLHK